MLMSLPWLLLTDLRAVAVVAPPNPRAVTAVVAVADLRLCFCLLPPIDAAVGVVVGEVQERKAAAQRERRQDEATYDS